MACVRGDCITDEKHERRTESFEHALNHIEEYTQLQTLHACTGQSLDTVYLLPDKVNACNRNYDK